MGNSETHKEEMSYAEFEVLTAVEMKIYFFSACNLLHVGLFFDSGGRGDISVQNIGWIILCYIPDDRTFRK
jgi:hypothetical protein